MARRGIVHASVRAGKLLQDVKDQARTVYVPSEEQHEADNIYLQAVDTLWQINRDLMRSKTFSIARVRRTVGSILLHLVEDNELYARLATIKSFDDYTFNHSVNVSLLSMLIGTRLGLSPDLLSVLGTAAMVHDIGKLTVPTEILNKPMALTEEEWRIMQEHPLRGAQIVLEHSSPDDIAVTVAFEHHAGYSGRGYPSLLPGRTQHLLSRIVAIADVFDALTSPRLYRSQLSPERD